MHKLLLSCDDYIYHYKGHYYTDPELMLFYQRYLRVFDKIRLVCRCKEESEHKKNRVLFDSASKIEIAPLPFFQGPKEYARVYFKVGKAMKDVISGCDTAILRIPSTVALRVGKLVFEAGIPYACEVVFDAQDAWRGSKGVRRFIWKKIDCDMRYLCENASGVSCVTEHYLQQHYFSKKHSAFTAHYSSLALPFEFYGSPKSFPLHQPVIIAHTANQIQFNGRKGINQIIESLSVLKKKGINVKARFAGADYNNGVRSFCDFAERLGVREMIEFVGFLNRDELNTFLSESDLYVMPTKAEGLPRVIIEAMAKGLPCITTPVSGNRELIDKHFLVDYFDVNSLANRIEEIINDKEIYEETSRVNYNNSLKYEAMVLQNRRDAFYTKLLQCVE